MHPYVAAVLASSAGIVEQCWLAGYRLRAHLFTMSLKATLTNPVCSTDVGMQVY